MFFAAKPKEANRIDLSSSGEFSSVFSLPSERAPSKYNDLDSITEFGGLRIAVLKLSADKSGIDINASDL